MLTYRFGPGAFRGAGHLQAPLREIDDDFSDDQRMYFKEVAQRAIVEAVNAYTVLSLGCQAFLETERIGREAEERARQAERSEQPGQTEQPEPDNSVAPSDYESS